MKRVYFIPFFCLIIITSVFSQSVQEDNRIIPPSPTVGELGKYGMIPVSHYTGVPDISVPLYTIECGSLKLPITLSYHAGGIRVEQIASWVGLGWSLNAGGIISANIMGASDFKYRANIKDFDDFDSNNFPRREELRNICEAQDNFVWDSQPDIYN